MCLNIDLPYSKGVARILRKYITAYTRHNCCCGWLLTGWRQGICDPSWFKIILPIFGVGSVRVNRSDRFYTLEITRVTIFYHQASVINILINVFQYISTENTCHWCPITQIYSKPADNNIWVPRNGCYMRYSFMQIFYNGELEYLC